MKQLKIWLGIMIVLVIALIVVISIILNTDYEFCFIPEDGIEVCSYQRIGDYLFGMENMKEVVTEFENN